MKSLFALVLATISLALPTRALCQKDPLPEVIEYCTPDKDHTHSYKMSYYAASPDIKQGKRPLVVLAPGAKTEALKPEEKLIDHNDPFSNALAKRLALSGFNVAVVHYRKFNDGVDIGDWNKAKEWGAADIRHAIQYLTLLNGRKINEQTKFIPGKGITSTGGFTLNWDAGKVILGGLSFGGHLIAPVLHKGDVTYANRREGRLVAGVLCSAWINPSDLSGYLVGAKLPIVVVHNSNDQRVPATNNGDWAAGGKAIADELRMRGLTVYSSFLTTSCSDGNHVPRVGVDSSSVVDEYISAIADNVLKLGY